MSEEHLRVVVSGSSWMGSGLGSIESALYQLFSRANDEITIVAYAISSATPMLFQQLTMMLQRGIRVRLLVNRFPNQHPSVQQHFQSLHRGFPHLVQVYSFTPQSEEADLHAKIVLVDRYYALVGSANLSLRGLMDNHELGVVIEGAGAADIARAIDLLLASPYVSLIYL
jgi:phosphatidylserine/phosphatidylglycerophosphate/cardiolipin synthase-like enzyme